MRRCLVRLLAWLLLGAIVNIAVCWTIAFCVDPSKFQGEVIGCRTAFEPFPCHWFVSRTDMPLGHHVVSYWSKTGWTSRAWSREPDVVMPVWAAFARPLATGASPVTRRVEAVGRGWPMIAMCEGTIMDGVRGVDPTPAPLYVTTRSFGLTAGQYPPDKNTRTRATRVLPLAVVWPGFAINTLLYAASFWLVFAGHSTARRMRRRWRGHCTNCGYDLRATSAARCPECGSVVNRTLTATLSFAEEVADDQSSSREGEGIKITSAD